MRLLLIEDDRNLAPRLVARLAPYGFVVEHAASAEQALEMPDLASFAALIVDVGLPGMNGLDFIRRLRGTGLAVPVLILTARGSWQEKVEGLNAGADDYIVKPVRAEELVARLQALLRRAAGQTSIRLAAGGIELDQQSKTAWLDDRQVELTQTEFRLLQLFLHRAGQVLSHGEILDHLYPISKERELNTLEVHIGRLRRKIGKDAIRTIRGLGYRLVQ
jgi:DNA-binding response OmpR family regulator